MLALTFRLLQLLDVFPNKSNLNLVLEFLDTDLEAVIRDKALLFQGADIKSWMLMTLKGLDFCHQNWILHRVRRALVPFERPRLQRVDPVVLPLAVRRT